MKHVLRLLFLLFSFSASAQLSDDFADGNFTANPTWTGDVTEFQVNPAFQLQSNGPATASTLHLRTPNTLFQNAEWSFYARLDFAGTNANQARIYLMSDQADLEGALNGYFIRLGEDGSLDAIDLMKQQGTTITSVISGINGRFAKASNNQARIRVTRDAAGNWSLQSDTTGTGSNFVLEGTGTDNSITSTAWFGVVAKYTSSASANRTKFYFDDFSITGAPLSLLSATAVSSTQVDVLFSNNVTAGSAQNTANYNISGAGAPASAQRDAANLSLVHLTLSTPLAAGTYTLTVNNVTDVTGTAIAPNSTATFTFAPPPPAVQPKDVVINEIYPDFNPVVGLPAAEFVELHNTTSQAISLAGFTFADTTTTVTFPAGSTIAANGYLIIVANSQVTNYQSFGPVQGLSSLPSLNDAGDRLTLKRPDGVIIDRVFYRSTWYNDPTKSGGGWTLELINPTLSCSGPTNWTASNDPSGGTPGRQNSVFSTAPDVTAPTLVSAAILSPTQVRLVFSEGLDSVSARVTANYQLTPAVAVTTASISAPDYNTVLLTLAAPLQTGTSYTLRLSNLSDCSGNPIAPGTSTTLALGLAPTRGQIVINEIYADFNPLVGLPAAEFIELHNPTSQLLDLTGLKFTDGTSTATLPSAFLAPGGYAIVASTTNAALFQSFGTVLGVGSFPSLNDDGDSLVLKTDAGLIIDRVQYSKGWYGDAAKSGGGWTLERKNPNLPCSGSDNWTASNDPSGGTPGRQNSVYSTAPDTNPPTLLSAAVLSSTQIRLTFSESLDSTRAATSTYTINPAISISDRLPVGPGFTTVLLTLATPLDSSSLYTVTVSNVTDCAGNAIAAGASASFAVGAVPSEQEVIINELMPHPNPPVQLPAAEYVELYNRSSRLLNLTGLKLTDGTSTATLPASFLAPGGYIILTSTANVPLFTGFGTVLGLASFPSLNDDGDSLVLKTAAELLIDQVIYTAAWYQDTKKDDGGYSLERKNPSLPCSGSTNWTASNDPSGGTPGRQNSVFSTAPDLAPPVLQSAEAISATVIRLNFNEGLDLSQLSGITVTLPAGFSQVSLQSAPNDRTRLLLTLSPAIDTGRVYSVTIAGARDCSGNVLNTATVAFGLGTAPGYQELLITEIMADPSPVVELPDAEYVELYNPTSRLISLSGLRFSDPSTTARLPDVSILPGQYVILCGSSSAESFRPYGRVIGVSSFPSLNSGSDVLTLRTADGKLVFNLRYTDEWYKDAAKADGGWSLEMIDVNNPCGGIENWTASTSPLGGTPGKVNSVQATNPDQTPPQLVRADVLSPTSLQLRFNEQLDSLSAASSANYSISNGISVTSVSVQGPPFEVVTLQLGQALQPQQFYTLTIRNLRDCAGNLLSGELTTDLVVPVPADSGDVVLNEVLFNPRTGGVDFVEVYNRSDKYVDLKDWALANVSNGAISNNKVVSTQPVVMGPGQYLVFTTNGSILKAQYPKAKEETFVELSTLPSYPNEAGTVILLNPAGQVMDRFEYFEDMHVPLIDDVNGVSLERIRPDVPSIASNWHSAASSEGYATPGYRNSQFQERPAISSVITIDPKVFTPDEDGDKDFTTINFRLNTGDNVATIAVFDSRGRKIKDLVKNQLLGTEGFYQWDGTTDENRKAEVGYYVFYVKLLDSQGNTQEFKETVVVGARF